MKVDLLGDSLVLQRALRDAQRAFKQTEDTAEAFEKKMGAVGKGTIKALGALPVAGLAAGAGVAAGLAAIPVALAAVAAFALSSNEQVAESFSDLWAEVKATAQNAAEPLTDTFVRVAEDLKSTVRSIAPDLKQMFIAAEPGIELLSKGINDLVRNAMPGMKKAVSESQSAFQGLSNFLGSAGSGVSDFFENLSQGSKSSGMALTELGRIVQTILGLAGSLVAKIANAFSGNFSQISEIVDRAANAIEGLADGALPVLSSAVTAALNVATAFLRAVEPIAGVIGAAGAAMLTAAAAGKALSAAWAFVTSGGAIAAGLSGVSNRISAAALSAGVLTESLTGSANAGERVATAGSKVGTVLTGLGRALPVVGVAVAVLAIAWEQSARSMEEAAKTGSTLGQSLIKGGNEADNARKKVSDLTSENEKLQASLVALEKEQIAAGEAGYLYSAQITDLHEKIDTNNATIDSSRKSYEEIKSTLTGVQLAQVNYNEAVAKHGPTSNQAALAATALRAEIDKSQESQRQAAEATKSHTDRLIEQQNQMTAMLSADLQYRNAVDATADSEKAAAKAISEKGIKSDEAADAIRALEGAQLNQITSAGALAAANAKGATEIEKNKLAAMAMQRETLNLAAATNGSLSPSLLNSIRNMNSTQLAANGVTASVNATGQAVLRLPNGKTITLGMNDYANWPLQQAISNLSRVQDKTVTVRINTYENTYRSVNQSGQQFGTKFYADGGWTVPGAPTVMGEEGPEFSYPSKRSYIVDTKNTQMLFDRMTAISSMASNLMPQTQPTQVSSNVNTSTQVKQGDTINITFGDIVTQAKDGKQFVREIMPEIQKELLKDNRIRTGRTGIA